MPHVKRLLALFLALAAAACAQVPPPDLAAYTTAYDQARTAGNLLLDEVSPLVADAGAPPPRPCDLDEATGFRPCFTPAIALGQGSAPANESVQIKARRAALDIVAVYNSMLSGLVAGQSAEALTGTLDQVTLLASTAAALADPSSAPLLAGFVEPFRNLAGRLERIRASNLAATSVLESEDDVRAMLRLLMEDTSVLYDIYVDPTILEGDVGKTEIALARAELVEDTAEVARLTQKLAAMSDPGAFAARARGFEAALTGYVKFLDQSERALTALSAAIRAPSEDPLVGAATFIRQATEARLLADQFLADVTALKSLN